MEHDLITRLRLALLKYGGHIQPCPGRPCECGFLAEWRAAALPELIGDVVRIAELKPHPDSASGDANATR